MSRKHIASLSVLLVVTSAVCWPFLRDIGNVNANDDWQMRAARHAAWRRAVLEHHQVPLRSPYFGGGYPTLADPEDPFLSPSLLATLCLGEVAGLKVAAFGFYLAAGLGMYYLAFAVLGYGHLGALWAALLFALCGLLPSRHFSGNVEELQYGLIPFVIALFIQAKGAGRVVGCRLSVVGDSAAHPSPKTENRKPRTPSFSPLALLVLLLLAMMMDGKLCWASLALFLLLFSIVHGVRWDGPRVLFDAGWLKNLAIVLAVVALLGMARILPVVEFLRAGGSGALFMRANTYSPVAIRAHSTTSLALGLTSPMVDSASFAMAGLFFGPVALAAFLVCALARLREFARWLVLLLVFLWLSMAHNAPVDLFRVLQKLPVFSSMSMPAKYFDPFVVFVVCVVAGRL
ncbi:MAG: hypothetical protein FJ279_14395, partial [Planctomycetes bacterium]|nr:hypothetical protein [Planctomycetota bacterium]